MEQGINRALAVTGEIVRQNPAGVASLFRKYGIKAKPTGQNLFFATVKHKGQFVNDLFDHVESPYSGADGDISPLPPIKPFQVQLGQPFNPRTNALAMQTTDTPKKKGRFFDFMNNVISTAAGGVDVLNKAKSGSAQGGGTYSPGGSPTTPEAGNKNLIFIGIGIVVVLVLAVFLIRKK